MLIIGTLPESKFLPSLCPRYTFYLKNRVFGECGANIMSQILEKLKVNSLQVERREERIEAIVKRERSDIENYNSKIRKYRIQEGIINYLGQMYIVSMSFLLIN